MKPKQPLTEARKKQLEEAREILASNGKSPSALAKENKSNVIDWIYRWGYSSSPLVQELLGKTSGGYALKLLKKGLLDKTKTESGMPAAFFTLTITGLEAACSNASKLYPYREIDPFRIDQRLIRHNLLAQEITINALNSESISDYETERMFLAAGDKLGEKHPDVVWITNDGMRIGVEVELSAKWGRDLDEFIHKIILALQESQETPPKYNRFSIISDSNAIIKRYKDAIKPGATLPIWEKNKRKHWDTTNEICVPDWLIEKVDFVNIKGEEYDK